MRVIMSVWIVPGETVLTADALPGELESGALTQAIDRVFAGDIHTRSGQTDLSGDGGCVDDGTTPIKQHGCRLVFHQEQHPFHIDIKYRLVVLSGLYIGRQSHLPFRSGVVEHDVKVSEGADRLKVPSHRLRGSHRS